MSLSETITNIIRPIPEGEETSPPSKNVVTDLKNVFYASKDISDFTEFMRGQSNSFSDIEGKTEFTFSLSSEYLKYACSVLKPNFTGSKILANIAKIVLFDTQLKIMCSNSVVFGEVFLPLSKISSVPKDSEVAFVLDFATLSKLADSFGKSILNFTYTPKKLSLFVDVGDTHLEIDTQPLQSFSGYPNIIKNIRKVDCVLNLEMLQNALNYLFLFAQKDLTPQHSIFDNKPEGFLGGGARVMGMFKADSFSNLPLKITHEVANVLVKTLPFFAVDGKTQLFETDTFYIFRDQHIYLGLEKATVSFPGITKMLNVNMPERYIISRSKLLSSLQKLQVISNDTNVVLNITISGKPPQSSLTLSIGQKTGRMSKDTFAITRQTATDSVYEQVSFQIILQYFLKTVSFFKSPETTLSLRKEMFLLLEDTEEGYSTKTLIPVLKATP